MNLLEDTRAEVEEAKSIEAGFAAFVRGFVTKIRVALGDAYDGEARAIMDEAGNNAEALGAAARANTDPPATEAAAEPGAAKA